MATSNHTTFARSDETGSDSEPLSAPRGAAGRLVLKPEGRLFMFAAIVALSFAACFVVGLSVGTLLFLVCLSIGNHYSGLLAVVPDLVETAAQGRQAATASFVVSQRRRAVRNKVPIQDSWLPAPRPTAV